MARIVVVYDDARNRLLLATIIEHAGHEFFGAADGYDGLRIVKAVQPDLIIMDLHMPGMSGADFITALRADEDIGRIPVALYTATSTDEGLRQFMELTGVRHVIPKPSEPREVIALLDEILSSL